MNIIEKLEIYISDNLEGMPSATLTTIAEQLRAIIDEFKSTQEPLAYILTNGEISQNTNEIRIHDLTNKDKAVPLFTHPQLSDETVKDAARYKFLRDVANAGNNDPMVCNDAMDFDVDLINVIELDHRVDQAMRNANAETEATKG